MSTESIMVRLRRANPLAQALAGEDNDREDNDLFARIIALPSDPRSAHRVRRPTERRRRVLVLAFALAVAALLASTAFAISQWIGGDVVRPPVTRQEYLDAQKQLTLPPGATWPKFHTGEPNSVTPRGGGSGQAVLVAQNAWECYWVEAIKRNDAAAGQRAQDELNRLLANNIFVAPVGASENWAPTHPPSVPFVFFAHDGGLNWIRSAYKEAAAGNPQNLMDSCRANRP